MLACFSALNESSNLESTGESSDESEEIPEYQVQCLLLLVLVCLVLALDLLLR